MTLHFPVFLPVRGMQEFPLVKVNDEMTDCLPIFTSKELAELYVSQEGSGMNLSRIDDKDSLVRFVQEMIRDHGVKVYAINFTFHATVVTGGPVSELLDED